MHIISNIVMRDKFAYLTFCSYHYNVHNYICDIWCIYIYSLAGLLIVVLLWVLFTSVSYVVIATHAG